MFTSVVGIYHNGRIELTEQPVNVLEGAQVIVTFIQPNDMDLSSYGIDRSQAETLRSQLATFADDWSSPEMDIYDNYDAVKASL